MLVGAVGCGKTTIMKVLTEARGKVKEDFITGV
jgi:ABC-type nitrate/sulfonate/bicarbonate transport system ATPase subunit